MKNLCITLLFSLGFYLSVAQCSIETIQNDGILSTSEYSLQQLDASNQISFQMMKSEETYAFMLIIETEEPLHITKNGYMAFIHANDDISAFPLLSVISDDVKHHGKYRYIIASVPSEVTIKKIQQSGVMRIGLYEKAQQDTHSELFILQRSDYWKITQATSCLENYAIHHSLTAKED